MLGPHRVIFNDHGHFYGRNATAKYRLDVAELRQAFGVGARIADRIREFQADRLLRITQGETPDPNLQPGPKIILHIAPLSISDTDEHALRATQS